MPAEGTTAPRTALEAQGPGQSLLDYAVSNSPVIFYIAEVGGLQPLKFISSNIEAITGHLASVVEEGQPVSARPVSVKSVTPCSTRQ